MYLAQYLDMDLSELMQVESRETLKLVMKKCDRMHKAWLRIPE